MAIASLYQPERGMEFQYRGQRRWTGVWDNPNTYGVLMGVGTVLAVGLLVRTVLDQFNAKSQRGKVAKVEEEHSTSNEVGRGSPLPAALVTDTDGAHGVTRPTFQFSCSSCVSRLKRIGFPLLLIGAGGLCGFGLLKSYSRGAWLGTAVGIGYLIWKFINREPREIHENLEQKVGNPLSRIWRISRLSSSFLPISVLLASVLVISFWQFRHTESPVLRRVFSVGNPNDFSWRNRVTAWQGAGRMILDKPIIGFGWGKAEGIYSKEYRAARLEESAAVQLNDYLMIGISAGVPALACLVAYLWLALRRGQGKSEDGRLKMEDGGETAGLQTSDLRLQTSTTAAAGVAVLLIGFWFDGGLFKLPTCVVFWVLLELARGEVLTTKLASQARHEIVAPDQMNRLRGCVVTKHTKSGYGNFWSFFRVVRVFRGSNESCPEFDSSRRRLQVGLRWLSGIVALFAIGLTVLHLGTPQLAVSGRTLNIARKFLVPLKEKADFEYLAAKPIWSNTPLKTLLQHAHLANYNRTLVNWNLDDQLYREFVLSPEILVAADVSLLKQNAEEIRADSRRLLRNGERVSAPSTQSAINHPQSTDLNWRRPLWEYFYPRIRKESSLEAAAEIVVRNLNETCKRDGGRDSTPINRERELEIKNSKTGVEISAPTHVGGYKSVLEIWQQQTASDAEFERIYVAALRSAGIPARLTASGQAEFWNGAEWKPAPRRGGTVD